MKPITQLYDFSSGKLIFRETYLGILQNPESTRCVKAKSCPQLESIALSFFSMLGAVNPSNTEKYNKDKETTRKICQLTVGIFSNIASFLCSPLSKVKKIYKCAVTFFNRSALEEKIEDWRAQKSASLELALHLEMQKIRQLKGVMLVKQANPIDDENPEYLKTSLENSNEKVEALREGLKSITSQQDSLKQFFELNKENLLETSKHFKSTLSWTGDPLISEELLALVPTITHVMQYTLMSQSNLEV